MKSVSYLYRLGVSTVSYIIKATCKAIWEALKLDYLAQPTENQWRKIADDFETKWNFSNCVGAIDGKHVRLQVGIFGFLFYTICFSVLGSTKYRI